VDACNIAAIPFSGRDDKGESDTVQRMRTLTNLTLAFGALALLSTAAAPVQAQQAGATVSIMDFMYSPADVAVKVGQPVTIANEDDFPHTVTAKDGTFDLDVPANAKVTLSVSKAGAFPYTCTYHPGQHNPATINVA
jgi:plastocyanin